MRNLGDCCLSSNLEARFAATAADTDPTSPSGQQSKPISILSRKSSGGGREGARNHSLILLRLPLMKTRGKIPLISGPFSPLLKITGKIPFILANSPHEGCFSRISGKNSLYLPPSLPFPLRSRSVPAPFPLRSRTMSSADFIFAPYIKKDRPAAAFENHRI